MEKPDQLTLAIVQTDIYWEDIPANLASLEEKISALEGKTDLILLPEMFSTGFSMRPEKFAEPMNLVTTRWLRQMALHTGALMMGTFAVREHNHYYNRLLAVFPDGTYGFYDKRHLFRMSDEQKSYSPGEKNLVLRWKGWNIRPLICYDLRFPVWSRNTSTDPYDLLVYLANWPSKRAFAWESLLTARAIENQCYVAGVNRTGTDGSGTIYTGGSAVLDFTGKPVYRFDEKPGLVLVTISKEKLQVYREKFPVHLDADPFEILTDINQEV